MSRKTAVVLYEPCGRGHRFMYVNLLLRHLEAEAADVYVATHADEISEPEFQVHLLPKLQAGDFTLLPLRTASRDSGALFTGLAMLRQVKQAVEGYECVLLVVPEVDRVLPQWLLARWWLPNLRCHGLLMRPQPAAPRSMAGLGKRSLMTLASLDPRVRLYSLAMRPAQGAVPPQLPDPIMTLPDLDRAAARGRFGLAPTTTVVGVVGRLDRRKNLRLILTALLRHEVGPTLLLVGSLTDDVSAECGLLLEQLRNRQRLVQMSGVVIDQVLQEAILASDVVPLIYDNPTGSSGIALLCASLGTPVIAAGNQDLLAAVASKAIQGEALPHADDQRLSELLRLDWLTRPRQPSASPLGDESSEVFASGLLGQTRRQ